MAHDAVAPARLLTARALPLSDPQAQEPSVAGAKAANLARAAGAHLPVLRGFVIPTTAPTDQALADPGVRELWRRTCDDGARPLVVRSSSTAEDTQRSSLAGQFTSVLDVIDWEGFCAAVREVRGSAERVGRRLQEVAPMAVLVQPQVSTTCAGVLFGIDPVSGNRRRLLAEAVAGSPDELVSGRAIAERYLLDRRGRRLEAGGQLLDGRRCRRLARLAARTRRVFGGPQDVEWGYDASGRLWLLQSRPVTAVGERSDQSATLLGPGPVAETFPSPLRALEVDLWVSPLADGITEALCLTGAATRRHLQRSPVVTTVGGRVAADLSLLGAAPSRRRVLAGLAPLPAARHLAAAWRVGRLRAALPALADDLTTDTDAALAAVPPLDRLADDELLALLERCRQALVAVHGHEALAGALLPAGHTRDGDETGTTAAGLALREVAAGRHRRDTDDVLIAEHPVVLALVPPRVGQVPRLPQVEPRRIRCAELVSLSTREQLRLRTRWLQELTARAAAELGMRLHTAGRLAAPDLVAQLTMAELGAVVEGAAPPPDLAARQARVPGPPLPTTFRLTPSGDVRAVAAEAGPRAGTGAAAGRATGRVVGLRDAFSGGDGEPVVLVTRTLDPDLAPLLPGLAGLVAETGSVLSHLAILARELHVPTVVAVPDAAVRFPPGSTVLVDGQSGEVRVVHEAPQPREVSA